MLASFILVGSWIPFMGDPCPGCEPPKDPTVAASPNNPTAASSYQEQHQSASSMDEVRTVFERLVDGLPALIPGKFLRENVMEKIQYAGLPCPLVIRSHQMHTLPGISLPASLKITT